KRGPLVPRKARPLRLARAQEAVTIARARQCSDLPQQPQLVIAVPSFYNLTINDSHDDDPLNTDLLASRRNPESVPCVSSFQSYPHRHAVTLGEDVIHANMCIRDAAANVGNEGLEFLRPVYVQFRISQPMRHTVGAKHLIY